MGLLGYTHMDDVPAGRGDGSRAGRRDGGPGDGEPPVPAFMGGEWGAQAEGQRPPRWRNPSW